MKTLQLIILLFIGLHMQGQIIDEQKAIKEKHIDLTSDYIYFKIHGLIEVNGHLIKNDTSKCPYIYKADKNGILIYRNCDKDEKGRVYTTYQVRECGVQGCKILHLQEKIPAQEVPLHWWNTPDIEYYDNYDNNLVPL